MAWLTNLLADPNLVVYLGVALAVSEALALIPQVKSSGIIDFVIKGIKFIKDKLVAPKA